LPDQLIDVFPETDVIENSPRHQSKRLKPCGVRSINVAAVSLYLSGFPKLHSIYLLNLKSQNSYTGTYRGVFLG